jgi:murein DD-endopeptidase MepM/ murein hydrolase activator NlpD
MEPAIRRLCLLLLLAPSQGGWAEEPLYRLPWPDGLSFMFVQAPGGPRLSHISAENLHAVDIAMPGGTPVLAAREGVVDATEARHAATAEEEPLTEYGNFVRVRHADGTVALYAHLRHAGVAVLDGERVGAGDLLGFSGASGDTLRPILHFGVARIVRTDGREDPVSVPFRFYVGRPAIVFAPRAGSIAVAHYAGPAAPPHTALDAPRLVTWQPRGLTPEEEKYAWLALSVWLAFGVAGVGTFWWFARR